MSRLRTYAALTLGVLLPVAGCSSEQSPTLDSGIPRTLLSQARPIARALRFHPPATGPVVGRCSRRLGLRYGVHVELFAANRVVLIPASIGTRAPRTFSAGRVSSARCYGALVTLEPTGVALVRPGSRLFTSDLFRAWGQPIARRRVASFTAPHRAEVAVFVDGRRWHGAPSRVPLARHSEIVLEVGPYVPPHASYTFPPGT